MPTSQMSVEPPVENTNDRRLPDATAIPSPRTIEIVAHQLAGSSGERTNARTSSAGRRAGPAGTVGMGSVARPLIGWTLAGGAARRSGPRRR